MRDRKTGGRGSDRYNWRVRCRPDHINGHIDPAGRTTCFDDKPFPSFFGHLPTQYPHFRSNSSHLPHNPPHLAHIRANIPRP